MSSSLTHALVSALLAVSIFPSVAQGAEAARGLLIVVDNEAVDIDGAGLRRTVAAYVSEIDVDAELAAPGPAPGDREATVALATEEGRRRDALVVMWLEPVVEAGGAADVTLVLLDVASGAVVAIPVFLGARDGAAAHRVIAATARTVLDTQLLEAVQEAESISEVDPPPEPWPAPEEDVPRTLEVGAGYFGGISLGGGAILNGARAGLFIRLSKHWTAGLEVAYLTGLTRRVADLSAREQRLPLRLAVGTGWSLGVTEGEIVVLAGAEPVWVAAEPTGGSGGEDVGNFGRVDAGGGIDLRWRFPIVGKLWLFASVGAEFFAVSHHFVRDGEAVVQSSSSRIEWGVGLAVVDL